MAEDETRSDDIDRLFDRPWPRGRAGSRKRSPGVAPLELSEPLWFEERRLLGPRWWPLALIGLGIFVYGVLQEQLDPRGADLGVAVWALSGLLFFGFFVLLGQLPRARGLKHVRVGPEGMVIGRWEVPASQVREVWALPAGDGGRVAGSRTADGARVQLVNFPTPREEDWKRVKAVVVRWHDAPMPIRTSIPGRVRDVALLIATKDPEGLAGALSRFPNAHRAAGLPELER